MCVSFCNQPKAQFGYLRRFTPQCRYLHPFCGWRHLATSRESKAHFGLPWVCPWDNHGKCYMDGKRIQCWSNALQHIAIYLQPFTSYSEILVGNCNFFLPSLHLMPPLGCSHWNSGEKLGPHKTRIMGLPGTGSEDSLTIGWVVSTQYQRVTDRWMDGRPAYSYSVRSKTDAR